jgi:hypothetical protein
MPLFKILAILKELINPQTKNLGICFFKFFLVSILSYTKDFNNLFAIRKSPLFSLFSLFAHKPKIKIMNKLLKKHGFNSDMQYYQMIVMSVINGQIQQAKEQFKAMPKNNKSSFVFSILTNWETSLNNDEKKMFFDLL